MAFISSELIPAKLHGTKFDGLVHGEWGSQCIISVCQMHALSHVPAFAPSN